jgi:hypothetical protein
MRVNSIPLIYGVIGAVFGIVIAVYYLEAERGYLALVMLPFFIAALLYWGVVSLGCLWRHFLWKRNGYGGMPIVIYPVLFEFCQDKIHCSRILDPMGLWMVITPPQYKENDSRLLCSIEKRTIAVQVICLCVVALVGIGFSSAQLLFGCAIASAVWLFNATITDNAYKGIIRLYHLLDDGMEYMFEASRLVIYESARAEDVCQSDAYADRLLAPVPELFRMDYVRLLSIKFLLMERCARCEVMNDKILTYIEDEIIAPFHLGHIFFDREAIEITKLHMYYCMLTSHGRKSVSMDKLCEIMDSNDMSQGLHDEFYRIYSIGRYNRISDGPLSGEKIPFVKTDEGFKNFQRYDTIAAVIEERICDICQSQSELLGG